MKQPILRALALCLTTALLAGYCYAQDKDPYGSKTQTDKNKSTIGGLGTSSTSAYGTSSSQGKCTRLSKLMNSSIKNTAGESLGQVQDIIVDPQSGQISFVVLSVSDTGTGTGKITT